MARTWVRLYYTETAYYDYDNVWGLSIDPISLTGAEMYIQEGRKAQFSLFLDDVWITGGLVNNWGDDPAGLRFIRRVWVEIWDTPLDSEVARVIFAGFMLKDSIKFEVTQRTFPGTNFVQQLKQGTVTIYDWMSVFIKIHENSNLQLSSGQYVIRDQMQALFNDYSIDFQWPLNKCSVGFQLNIYPDFGTVFNNEQIWQPDGRYDNILARLYLSGTSVMFEVFKYGKKSHTIIDNSTNPPTTIYNHFLLSEYELYTVYGTSVIVTATANNNSEVLFTPNPLYPLDWTLAAQLSHFGLNVTGWDAQNTITIEGATYNITPQTSSQRLKLLASGTLTRTVLDITDDVEVRLLEWVNYLLNTQYASLVQMGNTPSDYFVTNRGFYPAVETLNLDDLPAKYYRLEHEQDTGKTIFDTEYSFVAQTTTIKNQINAYTNQTINNRPNRITITTDVFILYPGQALSAPSIEINQMYITSKAYDFETKLTTYEGR